ncbi:invasion associated locus B family protein [Devosia alba]|uniref:invasion associated locus B family protein n=1 Tax=Devosia alba TaxID=3152360 RepID=UPI003266351B
MSLRLLASVLAFMLSSLWLSAGALAQEASDHSDVPKLAEEGFGDWLYRCAQPSPVEATAQQPVCEISQSVMIKPPGRDTGGPATELIEILNLTFLRANDLANKVEWALAVLTPLDVHLISDFGLRIGTNKTILARYRNCNHQGCWVIVPIDKEGLESLKRSAEGVGAFRLITGQDVNVSFSLIGFTKAYNALVAGSPPNDDNGVAQ